MKLVEGMRLWRLLMLIELIQLKELLEPLNLTMALTAVGGC